MGNIDGLRQQVEEMKQRLSNSAAQKQSESQDLKARLTSVKSTLLHKQGEIDRLAKENEQLRGMLSDLIATMDSRQGDVHVAILREFFTETAPLIETGDHSKAERREAAGAKAAGLSNAQPGRAAPPTDQPAPSAGPRGQATVKPEEAREAKPSPADMRPRQEEATHEPPRADDTDVEPLEDSPALQRIMKRGRRPR